MFLTDEEKRMRDGAEGPAVAGPGANQSPETMKMHSPGHSSAASVTASSMSGVTSAI